MATLSSLIPEEGLLWRSILRGLLFCVTRRGGRGASPCLLPTARMCLQTHREFDIEEE